MKMGRGRLLPIVRRPTPPHPFWIPAFAGMANERLPEQSIPDRSPGHAFVPIAHAGWCRHTRL